MHRHKIPFELYCTRSDVPLLNMILVLVEPKWSLSQMLSRVIIFIKNQQRYVSSTMIKEHQHRPEIPLCPPRWSGHPVGQGLLCWSSSSRPCWWWWQWSRVGTLWIVNASCSAQHLHTTSKPKIWLYLIVFASLRASSSIGGLGVKRRFSGASCSS